MTGTVLFLVLCVLVFRALGNPRGSGDRTTPPGAPWDVVARVWTRDVVRGARVLARLSDARGERLGRPWG